LDEGALQKEALLHMPEEGELIASSNEKLLNFQKDHFI